MALSGSSTQHPRTPLGRQILLAKLHGRGHSSRKRSGTTLVELLITLAVLGSLVAVASVSLISFQHQVALQQAATQFATDLTLARSKARRSSINWEVSVMGPTQYRLRDNSTRSTVLSLPAGVQFASSSFGSIVFEAPYGLVSSAPVETLLEGKGGRRLMVNIVGLGGKVVIRAAPNTQ